MTTTAFDAARLEALRATFSGQLLGPGDAEYEEVRRVHNGLIDRRPALIARCRSASDVAAAVRAATDAGIDVSVRGGGHNVAGRAVIDGALMIDLSLMKDVEVDPGAKTARAGGGVLWSEFNAATAEHGLATTGGAISSTGIGGLTLGGGLGWLMAKYGLAADNLLGVELVTADARDPGRDRRVAPRSLLGAARRRRELRRRRVAHVPPARAADGHRRPDRAPDRGRARRCSASTATRCRTCPTT